MDKIVTTHPFPPLITTMLILIIITLILTIITYKTIFRPFPHTITNQNVSLFSFFYSKILPNRALSRLLRPLTHAIIPKSWRHFLFTLFGKVYPVQWSDFHQDLSSYRTFHEFFTRQLIKQRS